MLALSSGLRWSPGQTCRGSSCCFCGAGEENSGGQVLFLDEGHGFIWPRSKFEFNDRAENILAQHLVGGAGPPGSIKNTQLTELSFESRVILFIFSLTLHENEIAISIQIIPKNLPALFMLTLDCHSCELPEDQNFRQNDSRRWRCWGRKSVAPATGRGELVVR